MRELMKVRIELFFFSLDMNSEYIWVGQSFFCVGGSGGVLRISECNHNYSTIVFTEYCRVSPVYRGAARS